MGTLVDSSGAKLVFGRLPSTRDQASFLQMASGAPRPRRSGIPTADQLVFYSGRQLTELKETLEVGPFFPNAVSRTRRRNAVLNQNFVLCTHSRG